MTITTPVRHHSDDPAPITATERAQKLVNSTVITRGLLEQAQRNVSAAFYRSTEYAPFRPELAALLEIVAMELDEAISLTFRTPTDTDEDQS